MTDSRPHALYRLYDSAERLLYVGTSVNLPGRLKQHRDGKSWWGQVATATAELFTDQRTARTAEQAAIDAERPRYNIYRADGKTPRRTIRVPDDLWEPAAAKASRPRRRPIEHSPRRA